MNRFARLLTSSIGRKILMALTGIGLIGFLVAHMSGNFLVYVGQEELNAYAAALKSTPLLWVARAGLLAIFLGHAVTGTQLWLQNRRARPSKYAGGLAAPTSKLAGRSMALSGLVVLAFVVFHLLHFTFGAVQPEFYSLEDAKGRHDVYSMVIAGFREPAIALSYVVAVLLLGAHLIDGARSFWQSLGLNHESYKGFVQTASVLLVIVLTLGNISMPLSIMLGLVGPTSGGQ